MKYRVILELDISDERIARSDNFYGELIEDDSQDKDECRWGYIHSELMWAEESFNNFSILRIRPVNAKEAV